MSIVLGTRSPIHNLEYALDGSACGTVPLKSGWPWMKRKSYWLAQVGAILGNGRICSNGFASGNAAGWCDHEGRRSANTAVARVATSPPFCVSSTLQCCDD